MVLHISSGVLAGDGTLLEFVKDGRKGLVHNIAEHIQTSSVGHTNRNV